MSVCLDDSEDAAQLETAASPIEDSVPNEDQPAGLSSKKSPQSPDISKETGQDKKRKRDEESSDCGNRYTRCLKYLPVLTI